MLFICSEMLGILNKVKNPLIDDGQISTRWIAKIQRTSSITRLWTLNVNGARQGCPPRYLRTVHAVDAALLDQTGKKENRNTPSSSTRA